VTEATEDPTSPTFRLLALLEGECLPMVRGRKAYKRPPQPPEHTLRQVQTPAWNWEYHGPGRAEFFQQQLVHLDANAAYLTAASSVRVARDALHHSGPWLRYDRHPGFYQLMIDQDAWQDTRWLSPLGQAVHRDVVWLAEPTVTLLQELVRADLWPPLTIIDSYTSNEKVALTTWTNRLKGMRNELLRTEDEQGYESFKLAYSKAIQMLRGSEHCQIRRADWFHAIRAQHAANTWRKVWKTVDAGCGPIAAGSVDALTFTHGAYMATQAVQPPLLRLDQTGEQFGTFKVVKDPDA
jgi:hypothetical protein